jgi:general secretion pathway protein I
MKPGSSSASAQHGFTLIEVLVALFIVALVLAAGLRATGVMTTTQQSLRAATMAAWSADNRLAELSLARALPALGRSAGPCPQADLDLHCDVEVSPSPNAAIRRVDVGVALVSEPEHLLAHRIVFLSALP